MTSGSEQNLAVVGVKLLPCISLLERRVAKRFLTWRCIQKRGIRWMQDEARSSGRSSRSAYFHWFMFIVAIGFQQSAVCALVGMLLDL